MSLVNRLHTCAIAVVALIFMLGQQISANDLIRLRATSPTGGSQMSVRYAISNSAHTVVSGDSIVYDVYLSTRHSGTGGIDVRFTDGTYLSGYQGLVDTSGFDAAPSADISFFCTKKWLTREIPFPAGTVGKTIDRFYVVIDGHYTEYSVLSANYDNIAIKNGASTSLSIYSDGMVSYEEKEHSAGASGTDLYSGPTNRPEKQIATHLFYWYHAPSNNAQASRMTYDPYGLDGDPWEGYAGGYYSVLNTHWWEAEFQDMARAGIDIAALICWGDNNWYFNNQSITDYMVPALERSGVNIKIAMFDDTTSQACEWNVDNGRIYFADPPMPISDTDNWHYFYDDKVKPFFEAIPQKYWATHNGKPLEEGGRPVIITYSAYFYDDVPGHGAHLYQWVKDRFAADFTDKNGNPITPWLLHEKSWFDLHEADPADGRSPWGAALAYGITSTVGDYTVSNIGPGYDDRFIRSPGTFRERNNNGRLVSSYDSSFAYDSDMTVVETWNELWEGTPIARCKDYPDKYGGYLPETYYMDTMRDLRASGHGLREYDATFLRTWLTSNITRPGAYMTVSVRNDGFEAWPFQKVALWGRLKDSSTGQTIAGTERQLAWVGGPLYSGQETDVTFRLPSDWPSIACDMELDLVRQSTWFSDYGDRPFVMDIILYSGDTSHQFPVTNFSAQPADGEILLSWRNSSVADNNRTVVRYSTSGYPSSVTNGAPVTTSWGKKGETITYTMPDPGLAVTYYFSAFSVDNTGNVSTAANAVCYMPQDTTPPAAPSDFSAVLSNYNTAKLSWINPSNADFLGITVRYATEGAPQSHTDGEELIMKMPKKGSRELFFHSDLAPDTTYYYCAFAFDTSMNYSVVASGQVTTPVMTCRSVKDLQDGFTVGLKGKIITAIYRDDGTVYITEPGRESSIRVTTLTSTLSVGDEVDIEGPMATVNISGLKCERQVLWPELTVVSSGNEVRPLGLTCKNVGGRTESNNVIGVNDGVGVNNVGHFVKICGRVTKVYGNYFFVDDGSGAVNISGYGAETGVMVYSYFGHSVQVGDFVSLTGIVQGSVPMGWSENRRYIKVRSPEDIVVYAE